MEEHDSMQQAIVTKFKKFRDQIFSCFTYRADATMELIDALSNNQDALSIVQLSLNPVFRRGYGSVNSAISNFNVNPQQLAITEQCLIMHILTMSINDSPKSIRNCMM